LLQLLDHATPELNGTTPGIMMRAYRWLGIPSYFQGLVPKIEFADRATVYNAGQKTCVQVGCFEDVFII
jgi:NAD(P)H-dependent FMN reductase